MRKILNIQKGKKCREKKLGNIILGNPLNFFVKFSFDRNVQGNFGERLNI